MGKPKMTDWITVEYTADPEVTAAIEMYKDYIMEETRCISLKAVPCAEHLVNINGHPCRISVKKADKGKESESGNH